MTLIPAESWPEARATNDMDLLLRPEIVTRAEHMKTIRDGLDRLGFEVVKGAEFYQFAKRLGGSRYVKVDLLAGPLGQYEDPSRVKVDSRRVKPKPSVGLHAHRSDEAVAYDLEPITVSLSGTRSSGEKAVYEVTIPQAFSYLMMKLLAFRDRKDDAEKEFAQHHALDLYRIVAMLSEPEYTSVQSLSTTYRDDDQVREASRIVSGFFAETGALGILRMREHPLFVGGFDLKQFIEVLRELFPK